MDQFDIQNLKLIPIFNVVERLSIPLSRNKKASCFVHDERTPSLSFFKNTNTWKCFGCSAGGDNISLVTQYLKISFSEACTWLSHEFNVGIKSKNFNSSKFDRLIASKRKNFINNSKTTVNPPDSEVYHWLMSELNLSPTGRNYLKNSRNLEDSTIDSFKLKDIPFPETFYQKAIIKWGTDRLTKAGLVRQTDDGLKFLWWQHVIVIPFFNEEGRITYLQGRFIDGNKFKYMNLVNVSPDLFNAKVLSGMKPGERLLLCEGAMDAMMVSEINPNVIGIPGATSFKKSWFKRILRFDNCLIPDNDEAGEKLFSSLSTSLLKFGATLKRMRVEKQFKDISEMIIAKKNA